MRTESAAELLLSRSSSAARSSSVVAADGPDAEGVRDANKESQIHRAGEEAAVL